MSYLAHRYSCWVALNPYVVLVVTRLSALRRFTEPRFWEPSPFKVVHLCHHRNAKAGICLIQRHPRLLSDNMAYRVELSSKAKHTNSGHIRLQIQLVSRGPIPLVAHNHPSDCTSEQSRLSPFVAARVGLPLTKKRVRSQSHWFNASILADSRCRHPCRSVVVLTSASVVDLAVGFSQIPKAVRSTALQYQL